MRRLLRPVLFGAVVVASATLVSTASFAQSRPGYYTAAAPGPDLAQVQRDKQSYSEKLQADLDQKEALLIVQQKLLDAQNTKLTQLREQLISLTDQPADDSAASDSDDPLVKAVPPSTQAARSYTYELYRANVMLAALQKTQGEIASIKEFMRHVH